MSQDFDFAHQLYYNYNNYFEKSLTHRRFKHADIMPLIEILKGQSNFEVKEAGRSVSGRSINLIKFGHGSIKIFLWSQMHGDESTATMALFDIFNFLKWNDHFNDFRNMLLNNASIYFMPMVNPDGAENFQRRNGMEIDLNRDAVALQSPEARVLKNTFDELKADFGFNLHDQDIKHAAGHTFKPATLSFLAPPEGYDYQISEVRANAAKLIGHLYTTISSIIPGHIGKYPSDFEPRAFGDNFQKLGTSTILIESGSWKNDPEKQFVRKLNFVTLLIALKSIVEQSYKQQTFESYDEIPFNESDLMSLIIRNVIYKQNGISYKIDIGINREEINLNGAKDFYYQSIIEDMGDLSVYFGYEDINLEGMEIIPGKTCPKQFSTLNEIENTNFLNLYEKGYTNIILNSNTVNEDFSRFPVNIMQSQSIYDENSIKTGQIPNFIIKKDGVLKYAVINGFIVDCRNIQWENKNGLVL